MEPQILYIVVMTVPYESSEVKCVCDSLELAKQYQKELQQHRRTWSDVTFDIHKYPLLTKELHVLGIQEVNIENL